MHGSLFPPLLPDEIGQIAENAIHKIGFQPRKDSLEVVQRYATNGREAVNIIQLAAGLALSEKREEIAASDMEWVVNSSQIPPRPDRKIRREAADRPGQRLGRLRSEHGRAA